MTEYKKPLPKITGEFVKEFYAGTKKHKLLFQRCNECSEYVYYPKAFCPDCLSSNLGWVESRGKGKVYTYTICRSNVSQVFEPDVPYVVAIVDLKEGPRLLTNIVDCKPEEVRCDMDVEVVFKDVTNEFSLPMFTPVKI